MGEVGVSLGEVVSLAWSRSRRGCLMMAMLSKAKESKGSFCVSVSVSL